MPEKKVMLHQLTRPAFEEYLQGEPNPVAIIAIGAIEQHGPHLPLGTDSLCAVGVASEVAQNTNSLVVHPCWPGYSPHHMEFAGTITFRSETLFNIIVDTVQSLAHHGIKKILLLNAHGGNTQIAAHAARIARRQSGAIVLMPQMPSGGIDALKEMVRDVDAHSGPGETGVALALFPELVEMQRVEGFTPTASFPEQVEALRDLDAPDLHLRAQLVMAYIGDTHEFTSSGVYGFADPNDADVEKSRQELDKWVGGLTKLIQYWKTIDLP